MPAADIRGHQRKIVTASVRPARGEGGGAGITLRGGKSRPFEVTRGWNAPAGNYPEQWFLVHPETREVLFASDARTVSVWGLPSVTTFTSTVREPIALAPGRYLVVFALGGIKGGELEVEASEGPSEAAA